MHTLCCDIQWCAVIWNRWDRNWQTLGCIRNCFDFCGIFLPRWKFSRDFCWCYLWPHLCAKHTVRHPHLRNHIKAQRGVNNKRCIINEAMLHQHVPRHMLACSHVNAYNVFFSLYCPTHRHDLMGTFNVDKKLSDKQRLTKRLSVLARWERERKSLLTGLFMATGTLRRGKLNVHVASLTQRRP